MSSSWGKNLHLTLFGESHSSAIGMTLEGIPAGKMIDSTKLAQFLSRRTPGKIFGTTERKETDRPKWLCGMINDHTCGTPLTAVIENQDPRSKDYETLKNTPRPGHADYTGAIKYHGFQDFRGGGHFSGRLTAALCLAGGICKQLLEEEGIQIITRIFALGGIEDTEDLTEDLSEKEFPVINADCGEKMQNRIWEAKAAGDSLGGIIECAVLNCPPGLGDPIFDGMENRIAQLAFGIPGVKGIEFGTGFKAAALTGSENNDAFCLRNGQIMTETNHCGGILGGITNGMPLTFKTAFKPTPSIAIPQQTVDLELQKEVPITIQGRHDTCIVLRALPCIESIAALAVYDAFLERKMH